MVAETKMAERAVNTRRRMGQAPYLVAAAEARAAAFTLLPSMSLLLPIHAGACFAQSVGNGYGRGLGEAPRMRYAIPAVFKNGYGCRDTSYCEKFPVREGIGHLI